MILQLAMLAVVERLLGYNVDFRTMSVLLLGAHTDSEMLAAFMSSTATSGG